MTAKIVISHSSKDWPWVEEFVSFLRASMDFKLKEIYCTTVDGTIPTGKNFIDHIKDNIDGSELVLFLLSENYFKSYFCLSEMGAAWITNKNIYPIVIPPLGFDILDATPLKGLQGTQLDEVDKLIKMVDEFDNKGIINDKNPSEFISKQSKKYYEKLKEAEGKIKVEQPKTIMREDYDKLLAEHKKATKKLEDQQETIQNLEDLNEELKEAKTKEDVQSIEREHSSDWAYFEELIYEARSRLKKLNRIIQSAIFYDLKNEVFYPAYGTIEASEAKRLQKEGKLEIDSSEGIRLNDEYPDINKAIEATKELHSFIREKGDILIEGFQEDYNIPLKFTAGDFWNEVFDINIVDADS